MDLTYKVGIDESELVQKLSNTKLMIDQTLQTAGASYVGGLKAGVSAPFEETMQSLYQQGQLQSTTRLSVAGRFTLGGAQLGQMIGEYTSLPFYQNLLFGTRPSMLAGEQQIGGMFAQLQQGPAGFMSREALQSSMRAAADPFSGMLNFQQPFNEMLQSMGQTGFLSSMRTPVELGQGIVSAGSALRMAQAYGVSGTDTGAMMSALARAGTAPRDLGGAFQAALMANNAGVTDQDVIGLSAIAARQRSTYQALGLRGGMSSSTAIDLARQGQYMTQAVAQIYEGRGQRFEMPDEVSRRMQLGAQAMMAMNPSMTSSDALWQQMSIYRPDVISSIRHEDVTSRTLMANSDADEQRAQSLNIVENTSAIQDAMKYGLQRMAARWLGGLMDKVGLGDIASGIRGMTTPVVDSAKIDELAPITNSRLGFTAWQVAADKEMTAAVTAAGKNSAGVAGLQTLGDAIKAKSLTGVEDALARIGSRFPAAADDVKKLLAGPIDIDSVSLAVGKLRRDLGISTADMQKAGGLKRALDASRRDVGNALHGLGWQGDFKTPADDHIVQQVMSLVTNRNTTSADVDAVTGAMSERDALQARRLYSGLVSPTTSAEARSSFLGKVANLTGLGIVTKLAGNSDYLFSTLSRDVAGSSLSDEKKKAYSDYLASKSHDDKGFLDLLAGAGPEGLADMARNRAQRFVHTGFTSANVPDFQRVIPNLISSLKDLIEVMTHFNKAR